MHPTENKESHTDTTARIKRLPQMGPTSTLTERPWGKFESELTRELLKVLEVNHLQISGFLTSIQWGYRGLALSVEFYVC